ncbi:YceD family protein [Pontibacterium granulatum]|uniref:YceD family protein n=1 Tax=Pontibacterium granulatum TaxID=2036029 RepID=UPI00249C998F|nr:YceD family protein [Pontibacterium granulatum]MDI3326243.1 YceD family protein [Pontibacterium granulatum]
MSYRPLPKKVDPRKLAERGVRIEGLITPKDLPRLLTLLCSDEGELKVSLDFDVDEQRFRTIQGSAEGNVYMTCQRCLEPVEVAAEATVNLAVTLNEDQVKQLPRVYDPLLLEEEEVELASMIEEELILSLPQFAYHDDCSVQTSFGEEETTQSTDKPNPFSVLAELKANNSKKPN